MPVTIGIGTPECLPYFANFLAEIVQLADFHLAGADKPTVEPA
jgi:hypothetical protein